MSPTINSKNLPTDWHLREIVEKYNLSKGMNKIIQNKIYRCKIVAFSIFVATLALWTQPVAASSTNNSSTSLIALIQRAKVTLNISNKPISIILDEIRRQTGVNFLIKEDRSTDELSRLSIKASGVSVNQALETLLAGTNYTFEIEKNVVTIIRKAQHLKTATTEKITLNGTVIDEDKHPVIGATVIVISQNGGYQNIGTITDANGKFRFNCNIGSVVEVSYSGMIAKTFTVTANNVNITLKRDILSVDDVVITGYQVIDKRRNTSAIQTLKMDDIKVAGVQTIDNLLEAKVPGMIFMQNSGQVGAAPKIRVRGTSTVLGNQEPLWVLDGVVLRDPVNVDPQLANNLDFVNLVGNAISGINPEDIDRIDILKDASSTALYGAKAANGVIVVTTKKGKEGPPTVTYNFNGKYTARPHYSDNNIYLMNSKERIDYSREIIEKGLKYPQITNWVGYEGAINDLYSGTIGYDEFTSRVSRLERVNTDWFDRITEDTFSNSHTVSLSGGGNNVRYYASLGYSNENGVIKSENNERYTTSMNISGSNKNFQYTFGLMANKSDRNYTNSSLNVLDYAYNSSRAIPAYNEDGSLFYYDKAGSSNRPQDEYFAFNILDEMKNYRDKHSNFGVTLNANVMYKFSESFKLQGTFGYSINNSMQETFIGENTFYAANLRGTNYGQELTEPQKKLSLLPFGGEYRDNSTRNNNYTARLQGDYNKFLDKDFKHQIVAALGVEVSSVKYNGMQQTNRCFIPERGLTISSVDPTMYPAYAEWRLTDENSRGILSDNIQNELSAYFSASYTYNNTYTVNFNTRADASNKFGSRSNEKILPVWSVSGSWDVKAGILKNSKAVNNLNLRTSYGYQGNMLDTQTPELIIEKGDMDNTYGEYTSTIRHYPNPNLRWEKTHSFNAGLDFSFFNNRLRGTLSYFYKKTVDAFLSKQVSDINGVTDYVINSGDIENKGFEISFNFTPIKSSGDIGGFRWDIDPQLGQIANTLLSKAVNNKTFNSPEGQEIKFADYINGSALIEGKPINTFYSYKYDGLSSVDGRPMFKDIDQKLAEEYMRMNAEDVYRRVMTHSGTRVPVIQGGISNTFSYKRFSLGINFAYSLGSKIRLMPLYANNKSGSTVAPLPERNARAEFNQRWRTPGDEKITNVPGLISNKEYGQTLQPWWRSGNYNAIRFADDIWQMYDNSDIRVASGNYFKLQSFTLNYSLSDHFCKKIHMKSIRIAFSGYNIFTVCSNELKGQAPTQSGTSETINLSLRPNYSLSVGLTF